MTDSIPFASISDDELLSSVRRLTARSNGVLAELLAHLGEVEARGIHRTRACASLYKYCVYELRMSEDAAFRRAKAARLVREHPEVRDLIAKGELHLTGLLMIGPYLGGERHREILERARFRSKTEIARLIARIDPKPEVPALVEPIGPAPRGAVTHREFVESLSGPVRTLALGRRPEDWIEPGDPGSEGAEVATFDHEPGAPPPDNASEPEPPLRYKVQFTASQEYVDLMNEAFDLLGHEMRRPDLPDVQLRAMRELVKQLKKRKRAATELPRGPDLANGAVRGTTETAPATPARERTAGAAPASPAREHGSDSGNTVPARERMSDSATPAPATPAREHTAGAAPAHENDSTKHAPAREHTAGAAPVWEHMNDSANTAPAREHTAVAAPARRIPSAVQRAVWARDGERCAYMDGRGCRCRETRGLELHHRHAYAIGGPPTFDNLEVRCKAHNALAAEDDFGREHMERVLDRSRPPSCEIPIPPQESCATQTHVRPGVFSPSRAPRN